MARKYKNVGYPVLEPQVQVGGTTQSDSRINPRDFYVSQGRINIQYLYSSSGGGGLVSYDAAGYALCGFWNAGGTIMTPVTNCPVYIPSNIEIISADIYIYSQPVYYQPLTGAYSWVQSKEIKVYKNPTSIYMNHPGAGTPYYVFDGGTDIHNTVFGSASWSPTAEAGEKSITASILGQLSSGVNNLYVKTSSTWSSGVNDENNNKSNVRIDVVVKGYIYK